MIKEIEQQQSKFLEKKTTAEKKALGQFFTSLEIAEYMASMATPPHNKDVIRILDAGSGSGILSTCLSLRFLSLGHHLIHVVLYELDSMLIPMLNKNMKDLQKKFKKKQGSFSFEIRNLDFVIDRPDLRNELFDYSSINPPYFKYGVKNSDYSGCLSDLYKGDPNIYASFMAIVKNCLHPKGEMIAIVPRSFTNGLYFKGFRKFLFKNTSLEVIHIFNSRNKVFKDLNVLQENIICKFRKKDQSKTIKVCTSVCSSSISSSDVNVYDKNIIIDDTCEESMIRIPSSYEDAMIIKKAEKLPNIFNKSGYFISTGPVVEHRTRDMISLTKLPGSVPLYRPHNIRIEGLNWTGNNKKDAFFLLEENHTKHTLKDDYYVLLKRFSSKDEKKRLVSAVYKPISNEYIGFGNKLNYLGLKGEGISYIEAQGLSAYLNSTFMDKYFRSISGNTQVNATEVRAMRFPCRKEIIKIGEFISKKGHLNQKIIDDVVLRVIEYI